MSGSPTAATTIIAFTDGAAAGNPGPGGWGVVIVTPDGEVTELGGGVPHTTNNRMEMTAAIVALEHVAQLDGEVWLYTDSVYLIRGVTEWVPRWNRNGWRTVTGGDVLNRDLWEELHTLAQSRRPGSRVRWMKVSGHRGVPGNERVDRIAVAFTRQEKPQLFRGHLRDYDVQILDLPADDARDGARRRVIVRPPGLRDEGTERAKGRHAVPRGSRDRERDGESDGGRPVPPSSPGGRGPAQSASKGKAAYSYLSLVEGILQRHATWPECEARVKGRSNARFKKARTRADEASIVRGWGLDPRDLPPDGRRS